MVAARLAARLGRYELVSELGRGTMGTVYRARDPILDREVAIKNLNLNEFPPRHREEILRRFRREAQVAGQLNHPHIVTLFDVGEGFLVMELVTGETLQTRLARTGSMALDTTLAILAALGEALDYAHRRGVVHRDVKPSNIVLGGEDRPKLMDFGLAHLETTVLTRAGLSLGSPAYMAPEQIQGSEPTPSADLYALAVVAYEMLTAARPFAGKNIATLLHQVVHGPPMPPRRFNESLPRRYDELFARALSKNPDERFEDAASFLDELSEPAPGPRISVGSVLSAGGGRRRALLALVPAVLLGIAVHRFSASPGGSSLQVDSLPAGATVSLGGVVVGTTPLTLSRLAPGERQISVAKEGFVTATEVVNASGGRDRPALVFTLRQAQAFLHVASTPTRASVRVDGREVGATPLAGFRLAEGLHDVEVRHRGYESFRARLEARAGKSLHFVARLKPQGR